ncbi:type I polyketide synthase [Trichlorobacter lovleyi]|uniref:Polyketide-type polyunsaturated fatty acid synthase PfaA n=1 Tax=Trichlorobacter lovleyi (strain ATCC BAA-1151 / DSM 17278 / SZ) TaxID=398767 RepID=B3E4P7_TRIL1|nr:type I polyketide synthase [Trichlorobacter lovleyi]ACD95983.1 polyketide-type polyunsaturated fatty acid synthase PfaA [Trichlorobacter lovleyi SZ]
MKQSEQDRTLTTAGAPLAIIGIGCLFPKSEDKAAYWATIREGVDAITEIPASHWRVDDLYDPNPKTPDKTYGKRGGFLSEVPFNPMEYNIPPNSLEAIDTSQLLGLVAAGQALQDAGYGSDKQFDRSKVSVILGVTGALEMVIPLGARLGHPRWREALKDAGVAPDVAEDVVQRISDSYVGWQENSFPGLLGNVVAGRISKQYDLGGTNCVVDAACASSFSALHLAGMELTTGAADMVVTGGVDTFNDIFMYTCFSKTPALSATGNAKPFDVSADGTILGEGLGLVVLKRLADAERDGDKIYAVVRGIGSSSDGKGEAIYTPSASGQQKAILNACANAGVTLDSIGLLEAHGTGTKVGDAVEVSAAREIFGEADQPWCAISSVKSQIGHAKAAAGSAGLIKAALALHHRVIPPTIKVTKPQDEVTAGRTPFYITTRKRPWITRNNTPRRAGVSAFGFGGSNFHTILEEYRPLQEAAEWDGSVQVLTFSSADAAGLTAQLANISTDIAWNDLRGKAASLRAGFDPKAACRLALTVERSSNLGTLLHTAQTMLAKQPGANWTTPDGICYASGAAVAQPGLLFPGQGAQYVGMLRDLACAFPQLLDSLEQAETTTPGLTDLIYPADRFEQGAAEQQEAELRATQIAQPAIGAVSLGALRLLETFGLKAAAAAGHSYGELTALCAAGLLDETSFHSLSRLRGSLMAAGSGGKGSMLAVSAPLAAVEQMLAEEKINLVIANRNAPTQAVLSGATDQIKLAEAACKSRTLTCKQLPVAAAFHSPLVADAAAPFLAGLADIRWGSGSMPVYANSSAAPYPADMAAAKELLAGQLARPVEFVAQIEAMYAAGIRCFVEVGPGARLSGLVKAILGDKEHSCVALDSSNGKRNGLVDLGRCLAQLSVLGLEINLQLWDEGYHAPAAPAKKPLLVVPLCGANYVKPKPKRPAVAPKPVSAAQPAASSIPVAPAPITVQATAPTASRDALAESLRVTREGMAVLQRMQEETAQLHRRFLEGQETASRTIQTLLSQQQQVLQGGMATIPAMPLAPVTTAAPVMPAPVVQPQPVQAQVIAQPAPVAAQPVSNAVTETLLTVVSEKTGYPIEMLELSMSMDADLGIDSIKRVEILSALQERLPSAPVIGPDQLGVLNTLGQIAEYLGAGAAVAPPASTPVQQVSSVITETMLAVVSEKTGYPIEMLELSMSMDADLGIDSIKRVEILSALQERLPSAPVIGPDQLGVLNTLGQIAEYLGAGAAVVAPAAVSGSQPADSAITETMLSVVSEKTGYPIEMLELTMSMDADLGIDSIKRVEILSCLQERLPSAPVIGPDQLGVLNTLGQIADYLGAGAAPTAAVVTAVSATQPAASNITETMLAVVSDKTGYPVEMLELTMSMDADLGIDSIKRVEILSCLQERLPTAPVIGPDQLGVLNTLGQIADYLSAGTAATAPAPAATPVQPTAAAAPSQTVLNRSRIQAMPVAGGSDTISLAQNGVIVVTDDGSRFSAELCSCLTSQGHGVILTKVLDILELLPMDQVAGLVLVAPADGTDDAFLKNGFQLLKQMAPGLKRASREGGALFATVSRLDGAFGSTEGSELIDPLSGGLAGLSKTARHEWPEVACKAIDLGIFPDRSAAAQAVARELFLNGPIEVGLSAEQRISLPLQDLPELATAATPSVQPGELVVITGGGRGVTAAAAVAMAKAWQPLLVLLGRSPLPEQEPDWLQGMTDEAAIKRAILTHATEKLHPREIEERYQATIAGRELRETMAQIQAVGGRSLYCSVDIRDSQAVADLLADLRKEHGQIRGLVHGAGVLADRLIVDKTREQFNQVYSTKVAGLRSLLDATRADDLRFIALFGSTTGRLGRSGQVDYAVANEVLNKLAQAEARRRVNCRSLCLNWGPWDGGMVTPALKKVFAAEGIGLIPLEAGADLLVKEIAAATGPVEVTVLAGVKGASLSIDAPKPAAPLKEALRLTLNVDDFPFISSHVIDNKAVLPMAMIVEWLAHAALHGNPGFRFHGFNDLRICKGVIIDRSTPCTLQLMAGKAKRQDAFYTVPVELVSSLGEGRSLLHARAEIILANKLPEGIRTIKELPSHPYNQSSAVYDQPYLFHGPDLHGIEQVIGCSDKGIAALVKAAPQPGNWIKQPLRSNWLTDPLVVDSAFQMMILWSFEQFGAGSLPSFAGRYRQFHETFPRDGAQVVIRVTSQQSHSAVADVEFLERANGKLIARLEGYECVIDASLQQAFQRNQLPQAGQSAALVAA